MARSLVKLLHQQTCLERERLLQQIEEEEEKMKKIKDSRNKPEQGGMWNGAG